MSAPPSTSKRGRPNYTPHFHLLRLVNDLRGVSPAASRTLHEALWCASPEGQVDEFGREGEGMFWRIKSELANLTGLSGPTQTRALVELRDGPKLLRWRTVHPGQRVPNGNRANVAQCVYYVDVWGFRRLVRPTAHVAKPGTQIARDDQVDRPGTITGATPDPAISRRSDSSPQSVSTGISVVKFNHDHSTNPAHPPQGGGSGLGSPEIETVFEAWWDALGRHALADYQRRGGTANAVRAAITGRLRDGMPVGALLDAIAAASDPHVGGKKDPKGETPYGWLKARGYSATAVIFRGSLDKLIDSARWHRQRVEARRNRPEDALGRSAWGGSGQPAGGDASEAPRAPTGDELAALLNLGRVQRG